MTPEEFSILSTARKILLQEGHRELYDLGRATAIWGAGNALEAAMKHSLPHVEIGPGIEVGDYEVGYVSFCGNCHARLQIVRPGKYQCPNCE